MSFELDELQAGGLGMGDLFRRYFAAQGVDLDRAVRDLEHDRERRKRATGERAEALKGTARALRRARRAAELEADCWRRGMAGYTLASVTEKRAAVAELDAELREAAGWDEGLISEVKRSVAG